MTPSEYLTSKRIQSGQAKVPFENQGAFEAMLRVFGANMLPVVVAICSYYPKTTLHDFNNLSKNKDIQVVQDTYKLFLELQSLLRTGANPNRQERLLSHFVALLSRQKSPGIHPLVSVLIDELFTYDEKCILLARISAKQQLQSALSTTQLGINRNFLDTNECS